MHGGYMSGSGKGSHCHACHDRCGKNFWPSRETRVGNKSSIMLLPAASRPATAVNVEFARLPEESSVKCALSTVKYPAPPDEWHTAKGLYGTLREAFSDTERSSIEHAVIPSSSRLSYTRLNMDTSSEGMFTV